MKSSVQAQPTTRRGPKRIHGQKSGAQLCHRTIHLSRYIHCCFRPFRTFDTLLRLLNCISALRKPETVSSSGTFHECCCLRAFRHMTILCSAKRSSSLAIAPSAPKRHAASQGVGSRLAAAMRSRAAKNAFLLLELNCLPQDIAPSWITRHSHALSQLTSECRAPR